HFITLSNNNIWTSAPTRAAPVIMTAISFGVKPNLWSTYKLKIASKAASANVEINKTTNANRYKGTNIRFILFVFTVTISSVSFCLSGSCNMNTYNIAAMYANTSAPINGTLGPISAKNPPIPGPIINPVLIAADLYTSAFARVSIVVISAI